MFEEKAQKVILIPHFVHLINATRSFAFNCYTVGIRAIRTKWK